jgi:mRNA interferase YafQ
MYRIVASRRFKKQLKKIMRSGQYDAEKLQKVIQMLQKGTVLPPSYRDHALKGDLHDYRECHIAPDWLLVYRFYEDILILELSSTGSHSQLF